MPVAVRRPFFATLTLVAVAAAIWITLLTVTAPVARAATRACGNLNYDFPDGNGGASAVKIRATNLTCQKAIPVVATCLAGSIPAGYRRRFLGGTLQQLSKGSVIIRYSPAGGGC